MSQAFQIRDSVLTHDGQRGEIIAVSSEGYTVRLDCGERQPFGADQLRVLGKPATNAQLRSDMGHPLAQPPSVPTREELAARNMAALLAQPVENYWSLQNHMAVLAHTAIVAAEALLEELKR